MLLHPSTQIIDSSKLQDYIRCPRLFFYRHVLGWRSTGPQFDLIFGEAMHAAMEVLYRYGFGRAFSPKQNEMVQQLAYQAFLDIWRKWYSEETDDDRANKNAYSAWDCIQSYCSYYDREFDRYEVLEIEGKKCVEVSGFVPITQTGLRMYFRQDAILRDRVTGLLFTLEHKTASRGGTIWAAEWDLSIQVGCYTHALYSLFPPEQVWGCRVNGMIFLKREVKFERVPCEKSYEQMQVWHEMVTNYCQDLQGDLRLLQDTFYETTPVMIPFPMRPTDCTKYNRVCAYHDFCTSWANPLQRCEEAPLGFEVDFWDPQVRKGKDVAPVEDEPEVNMSVEEEESTLFRN